MKIKETRVIEVPDKLICHFGRRQCDALHEAEDGMRCGDMLLCANFNKYVRMSAEAGFYVRCKDCIDAQTKYLREND